MNDLLQNYIQKNKYVVLVSNDLRKYSSSLTNRPYFQLLWDEIYCFLDTDKIQLDGKNELNRYRYHFHQMVFKELFFKTFDYLKKERIALSSIKTTTSKDMEYFFYGFEAGLPLDVLVGIQIFASNRIVVKLHNIEEKRKHIKINRIFENFIKYIGHKPHGRATNKNPLFSMDFSHIVKKSQISEEDIDLFVMQ